MIRAFTEIQSRAQKRRMEKEEARIAAIVEGSRRKAKRAADDLLRFAADTSAALEIREGLVLGAYRECCSGPEGPVVGRQSFVEMFGERLLRWVDDPLRAGRLDQYLPATTGGRR